MGHGQRPAATAAANPGLPGPGQLLGLPGPGLVLRRPGAGGRGLDSGGHRHAVFGHVVYGRHHDDRHRQHTTAGPIFE